MSSTQTSQNGLTLPGTSSPDVTNANDVIALLTAAILAIDARKLVQELTAAGAISVANGGQVLLKAGSAAAMTLAVPTAGLPSAGGQDGTELLIVALDAEAYTVTTPANGINGNKHIATFGGAVADAIRLVAYNGAWYAVELNGVTLT